MCSHKSITWEITDNSVTDRMIDNSLVHKFRPLRKLRRRTKVLNSEVKKHCGVKDYKHYVKLKTNVLQSLTNDTDTSDSSSLTDVDYDIIYSSPSKQAKYVAENSVRYIFSNEEDCEDCKRKNIKYQIKSRSKSTEKRIRKSLQMKSMSKKCVDVGWQEVKSGNISCLSEQVCTNSLDNEENILKNNDCNNFKTQSDEQSLSPRFNFRNNTASKIMKYGNKCTRQNHGESNAKNNKLSPENSTSNKTKPVSEKKILNHKNQNATMNESNTKFNSHHQSSQSQSTSLENDNDFETKSNTLKLKNNDDKVTAISNGSSNTKNYDNTNVNHKRKFLKNVSRNLLLVLEKVDSKNNNKDIETDKNIEDRLNCDQLLPSTISFNQQSTPLKKTCIDVPKIKDLSSDTLLDHQKDSGIDEDSQDRFVKIKESNKIATNHNMKENVDKIPTSPELKNNDEVIETAKDCEENEEAHLKFNNDILEDKVSKEEKEFSEEKKINSSQLNQVDINVEMNQENKEDKYLTKTEDTNDIQDDILKLLSPKQDCMQDAYSESCNHIRKEEDDRRVKKSFEKKEISLQEESLQLNEIDKAQVSSINHKGEDKKRTNEEKERKNFSQLNESDKDAKTDFISQEDKISAKLENTYDVQEQQILPKVMNTEILDKRYKIINKKDNDVKNNIVTTDNISNNTDITNEYTPVKKNTLIHCPNVTDYTDNWQKITINPEEIDASIALETDNEEINVNYVSPQIKKRLQQQARLNLVVNSDSNESDDEYVTTKTSQKHIDGSDKSFSNEETLKNNEVSCISKQTDISHDKEATSVSAEVAKIDDLMNIQERIKEKTESLTSCTYENNDLFLSITNENLIKENVNVYKSEHDQSARASTKSYSNAHLNTSCQYRPYNLQELIEDQELFVETMPTSFTLPDLSEDEEVFILNVPSKVVQHNLQGQVLKLTEKSLKFNKSKYRIVQKEMGTTSCIFATGKKRKPYKLINIKKISAITVREKLPQDSRKTDESNSCSTVSSVSKQIEINNRLTDEANSKILKVSNRKKRKRGESSDCETEYL